MKNLLNFGGDLSIQLEALREHRPPWPRQIITLILPTVKMLSLGCERLQTPIKINKTGDVCKTLTSRPFYVKHLPRSSPHLYVVHDETKSFGSTPLLHPLDAAAKKL